MECSNLEIRDIEIRACCSEARLAEGSLRSDSSGALNFLFLRRQLQRVCRLPALALQARMRSLQEK